MVFGSMGGASSSGSGGASRDSTVNPSHATTNHRQRCGIVSSRTTGTERADPGVIIAKGTTVTVSVTVRLPRGVNGAPAKNAMVTPVSDR
jgi:hypothetical protein